MGGGDHHVECASHQHGHRASTPAVTSRNSNATAPTNLVPFPPSAISIPLRLITNNIRYAATDLFPYECPWPERLPNLLRQIHHYAVGPFNPPSTILCLQEVLQSQLDDVAAALGNEWSHVGVGRDDGKEAGEFNPVFFRPGYWVKVHFETIWLSKTPERPGLGWDAGCNRICTCLVLRTMLEGSRARRVMILNTHLDNAGPIARREGAKLIVKYARLWREEFKVHGVLLAGDLNSTRDERHGAWEVLNTVGSRFSDVGRWLKAGDVRHFGDDITFTGFDGNGDDDPPDTLDFVHYGLAEDETIARANGRLQSYSVVPNLFDDGVRCSDHRAVVVDLLL